MVSSDDLLFRVLVANVLIIADVAPSAMLRAPDFDLDGDFVRGGISDNLKQSLSLIEKAETLPSCGKIATSALLHSCSALEGSVVHDSPLPLGSDLLIEEESDIYAARLAVCELSGADYAVPTECHSFLPKPNAKKTQSVKGWWNKNGPTKPRVANDYFYEVTAANLKQCRKALGSSSQAWTSYSNSRQNAVAMCHAMQSAVERDESRHIAEILAKTAAASAESLKDADERAQEIKQLFHELRTGMPQFQKDLAAFDANIQQRVQDYWDELGRAQISLEGLTAVMNHNHNDMEEMHAHLQEILGNIIPEMALAIANASQQAKDTGTNAVSTSELVAYHMERTQQSFIEKMATAGYELGAINDLVPRLNTVMQSTLDNTMRSLEVATLKQQEFALAQNASIEDVQRHREELASLGAELREARREARDARAAWKELLSLRGLLAAMGFANENEFVAPCATILGLLSGLLWRRRCSTTELILAVIVTMMGMYNVVVRVQICTNSCASDHLRSQSADPLGHALLRLRLPACARIRDGPQHHHSLWRLLCNGLACCGYNIWPTSITQVVAG